MNHVGLLRNAALAAITVTSTLASAADVCVPQAVGVPTRPGPPKWLDWENSTAPTDPSLDDPRWLGATARSFVLGSASSSLNARALWATENGKTYLYLSFAVDLEGITGGNATVSRDLFVGFRRQTPFGAEQAYIFQFHLKGGTPPGGLITPQHCVDYESCDGTAEGAPEIDFWRVFVNRSTNPTGSCNDTVNGTYFAALTGSHHDSAPISWMTHAAADAAKDAVRFWKLDASQPGLLRNQWAVQLRLPVAAADNLSLEDGIPSNARLWYQATAALGGAGGGAYAALGWFPSNLTQSVCVDKGSPNHLVHPELATTDSYSGLTRYSGATPPDECKGLTIDHARIGAVFNPLPGTNFADVTPTNRFKAGGTNVVIAQPVNTGGTPVTAPLAARFRLAAWGSAPLSATNTGTWREMRGAVGGVCAIPTGTTPPFPSPPACPPTYSIPAGARGAITFNWTIGDDPTLGASEFCMFGLNPPSGSCSICTCAAGDLNCVTGQGTQATGGPCVSANNRHQCMLVELFAPNGGVDFVRQSSWNNMNFDQMSIVKREALIDARQLPAGKDQQDQDIYFFVMPRNMPGALPPDLQDGTKFVQEQALQRAEELAAPYLKDIEQQEPLKLDAVRSRLGPSGAGVAQLTAQLNERLRKVQLDEKQMARFKRVVRAMEFMAPEHRLVVRGMLEAVATPKGGIDLHEDLVRKVGPAEAAAILPTLEIYPFYLPYGKGISYLPMSAFTVFLSHEGAMKGMTWEIDGAKQVGQNIYRMQIPVGKAKKIQVRAAAIEGTEHLVPGNPKWPCGGCCAGTAKNCGIVPQATNVLPGLLAGLYMMLRGRRRRRRAAAPTTLL